MSYDPYQAQLDQARNRRKAAGDGKRSAARQQAASNAGKLLIRTAIGLAIVLIVGLLGWLAVSGVSNLTAAQARSMDFLFVYNKVGFDQKNVLGKSSGDQLGFGGTESLFLSKTTTQSEFVLVDLGIDDESLRSLKLEQVTLIAAQKEFPALLFAGRVPGEKVLVDIWPAKVNKDYIHLSELLPQLSIPALSKRGTLMRFPIVSYSGSQETVGLLTDSYSSGDFNVVMGMSPFFVTGWRSKLKLSASTTKSLSSVGSSLTTELHLPGPPEIKFDFKGEHGVVSWKQPVEAYVGFTDPAKVIEYRSAMTALMVMFTDPGTTDELSLKVGNADPTRVRYVASE